MQGGHKVFKKIRTFPYMLKKKSEHFSVHFRTIPYIFIVVNLLFSKISQQCIVVSTADLVLGRLAGFRHRRYWPRRVRDPAIGIVKTWEGGTRAQQPPYVKNPW